MYLCECSASELARLIREKEVPATEVVQAHLERIEQVNPQLNAVVQLRAEAALAEARQADERLAVGAPVGPLHGVPMTIKDSLDSKDLISAAGTTGRAHFIPPADATVVSRLRNAGAILLGKTNTPELTLAYETDNLVYGRSNNPHDMRKTAGGSSGGAAAIIATGGAPFDIGSDTGGSIRWPAHCCGIAGFKPTQGRVPRSGHIISSAGYLHSLTHIGPMARFVEDLPVLLDIIAGPDGQDPHIVDAGLRDHQKVELSTLRIAFYKTIGDVSTASAIDDAIERTATALANECLAVEEASPACLADSYPLYYDLFHADGNAWVRALLRKAGTERPHPYLAWALQKRGAARSAEEFAALFGRWHRFRGEMLAFMKDFDAIICPVHSFPAFEHGSSKKSPFRNGFAFTITYNLTGWPAAAVCVGKTDSDLPIGVQIVAPPWREDVVLALAFFVESAFGGWRKSRPAMTAHYAETGH